MAPRKKPTTEAQIESIQKPRKAPSPRDTVIRLGHPQAPSMPVYWTGKLGANALSLMQSDGRKLTSERAMEITELFGMYGVPATAELVDADSQEGSEDEDDAIDATIEDEGNGEDPLYFEDVNE